MCVRFLTAKASANQITSSLVRRPLSLSYLAIGLHNMFKKFYRDMRNISIVKAKQEFIAVNARLYSIKIHTLNVNDLGQSDGTSLLKMPLYVVIYM